MNQKIIIAAVVLAIVGLGYLIFRSNSPFSQSENSKMESSEGYSIQPTDDNFYPLGQGSNIWDEALSPFQEENKKSYLEILSDLKSGKINFVWEVWALRSKCPKEYSPSQCDATILAYIDANYEGSDHDKIKDLYVSYFKYESDIRQLQLPANIDFGERYDILKEQRLKSLGSEKAELIFGMEEAQVNFMEGSQNFIQATKNMNPDERVKKFEELRKKTYGSYFENVMSREDRFNHYETEILLRESEMQKLSPEEKEKKLSSLEVKYFGKEKASLIAKARLEEKQEQQRYTDLTKKEEDLLKAYPNLSAKEKEIKIQELRTKILGKEDAEAYTRRLNFEKETSNY